MKLKIAIYPSLIIAVLALIFSCKKDAEPVCNVKYFIPEAYLDWCPYFTGTGDTVANKFFKLENKTCFLAPQELTFYSEAQDSQKWKLIYVEDTFHQEIYEGCPLYQEVKFTFYNNDLEQHIQLGFVYRDTNYVSSSANDDLYIPMLNAASCTTKFEYGEGLLGGTCYSTAFDVNNYADYEKIEFLSAFTTPFSTYNDVFFVKLNHHPDAAFRYDMYVAKNKGMVAYENQGLMWYLK